MIICGLWTVGEYGHLDKNRKYFLQFYGFKNNFQKQTNDKGPVDVKSGGPCKNTQ